MAKKKRRQSPAKKRGNKGNFVGSRLEYLDTFWEAYCAAKGSNDKTHKFSKFWPVVFEGYWERFDWRVPLTEEQLAGYDPVASEADLSEEEHQQKTKTVTKVEKVSCRLLLLILLLLGADLAIQQIKSHFSNKHYSPGQGSKTTNPFQPWLSELRKPPRMPRKPSLPQFYLSHPEFSLKVADKFSEQWPQANLLPQFELDFRIHVAKNLLEMEPPEVYQRLEAEWDASHALACENYKEGPSIAALTEDERLE
jgi:hypothetical protein